MAALNASSRPPGGVCATSPAFVNADTSLGAPPLSYFWDRYQDMVQDEKPDFRFLRPLNGRHISYCFSSPRKRGRKILAAVLGNR